MVGATAVRVLGPVELSTGRERPRLAPLERTLLAVLAANAGRLVTVDRLVDALWGQAPPGSARNRVQGLVSSLRRLGGDALVVTRALGYVLELAPERLDAALFERLVRDARALAAAGRLATAAGTFREALALWRGAPYEDVPISALAPETTRLTELRQAAVEELAEARLALGEHASLVVELSSLVAADPLRERLRGQLMLALHRSGRQAEALEVYRHGAAALADEYGLDPSDALQAIRDTILLDDPGARQPVPPAGTAPLAPNQLPAAISDFVGRAKEIQELKTLLAEQPDTPGASVVVSVAGMAGVGKTALAVRVAHELRDRYPGGCLYADLRGTDETPASPLAVLGSFLRASGVANESIPADLDERAALYRSVLDGRSVLVVLDNAADETQVRPLVPGAGNGVLVTSRRALSGLAGAHLSTVDTLTLADGLDLLARVAGTQRVAAEAAGAERLVTLCGLLPLAIRIAGVRLARHDSMTSADLGERLADERRRLDELAVADLDVRASLEVGYARLRPTDSQLLGQLCQLPFDTFAPWLGAALGGVPVPVAELAFERLREAQLLAPAGGDRYRMHDLVRLHGRERVAAGAQPETTALGALLHRARLANDRLPGRPVPVPPGPDGESPPADPVEWFEAERENLLIAVGYAAARGYAELAGQLAVAMTNFCIVRGYLDDWAHSARTALDAQSGGVPDPALLLSYGTSLRLQDRNEEALPYLRRAYREYVASGDRVGAAAAALSWSVASRIWGHLRVAHAALRKAFDLLAAVPSPTPLLGYVHLASHFFADGTAGPPDATDAERALAIFEALHERWGAAEAHNSLGVVWWRLGDSARAAVHIHASIEAYTALGATMNVTEAVLSLARIHVSAGDHDLARPLLDSALQASRRLHHPWAEATALRHYGSLHLALGCPELARPQLEESVAIYRRTGQPVPMAMASKLLAEAHLACGDRAAAIEVGREAWEVFARLAPAEAGPMAAWLSEA
ncbi:MAG TPA: BTAD domain-containing putative transcriptional regulator [Micromonosporaceae bacterium]|nr:BTAD domain-containing putative transcriptional regulator [Micromonosporaceae bacterium]